MEQTTMMHGSSHNLSLLELEQVVGGKRDPVKIDFTVKTSVNTQGTGTVEASLTLHF